jgi:hypothetical protein
MLPVLLAALAAAVPTADCAQHVEGEAVSARQRQAALRRSVRVHGATFWGLRNARTLGGSRRDPARRAAVARGRPARRAAPRTEDLPAPRSVDPVARGLA